jgi:hypothetical protein
MILDRVMRRCYRCGKPTPHYKKVVTSAKPKGRWFWWCGCGESLKEETHPRFAYDCDQCRFNWCCGPLCACLPGLKKAPRFRARQVAQMQADWRRRCAADLEEQLSKPG